MATPKPRRRRKFGDVYDAGNANLDAVAKALAQVASRDGFLVSRATQADGSVQVDARQPAPWHQVILRALPQRLRWTVQPNDAGTRLHFDRWPEGWYRAFTAGVSVFAVALMWVAFYAGTTLNGVAAKVGALGLLIAIALMFLSWRWTSAGGTKVERLWEKAHSALRDQGIRLDHQPELSRSRSERAGRRYLGFILGSSIILVAWAVASQPSALQRAPAWMPPMLVLLALIAAVLCLVLFRGVRRPGYEPRLRPALPGLSGLMAALFVVASQVPTRITAAFDSESWELAFAARDMLTTAPPSATSITGPTGRTIEITELRAAVSGIKWMFTVGVFITPLIWCLTLACLTPTVRSLDIILQHSRRLSEAVDLATVRRAISGEAFLGRFRASMILIWIIASLLTCWGLTALVQAGIRAAFGEPQGWTSGGSDIAGAFAHSLKLAFDLPMDSLAAEVASRWFWALWALGMVVLLCASVSGWVVGRHRTKLLLERQSARTESSWEDAIRGAVTGLAGRNHWRPRIAVVADRMPCAASYEFGLFRRRRFIAVTSRSLEVLDAPELKALLAHEYAHLIEGHCRKHALLQLLGRLTFVGDAFVGTLEHTFGYELAADRSAVENLGVTPDALRRCLLKLRAVATMQRLQDLLPRDGLGAMGGNAELRSNRQPVTRFRFQRLMQTLRLWLRIYLGETVIAYWHPSVDDRLRALTRLQ